MELTEEKAKAYLEEARAITPHQGWIDHSYCVGETAGIIARALGLDEKYARVLGLIHDIGKRASFENHTIDGYKFLQSEGYGEEYWSICLTHSYLNNDYRCTAGCEPIDNPFRTEYVKNHEYTIYDKIINLCDLMCVAKRMTVEKRLIEIMSRRGAFPTTQYHVKETLKLKQYFDDLLGHSIYDLFDDVDWR